MKKIERNEYIQVKLTKDEKKKVQLLAQHHGMTVGAYVRSEIIAKYQKVFTNL